MRCQGESRLREDLRLLPLPDSEQTQILRCVHVAPHSQRPTVVDWGTQVGD